MFKLDPAPTFPGAAQISAPGGADLPLKLTFKHKTTSALQTFLDTAQGRSDEDLIAEMVQSVDPDEKREGQSDAAFWSEVLEAYPSSRSDLLRSYLKALTESRIKN